MPIANPGKSELQSIALMSRDTTAPMYRDGSIDAARYTRGKISSSS